MNPDPQLLLSLQIPPPPCWCSLLTSPVPYRGVNEIRMFHWDTLIGLFFHCLNEPSALSWKPRSFFFEIYILRGGDGISLTYLTADCVLHFLSWPARRKKRFPPRLLVTWQVSLAGSIYPPWLCRHYIDWFCVFVSSSADLCSDDTDNSPPLQLHTLKEFEQVNLLFSHWCQWHFIVLQHNE